MKVHLPIVGKATGSSAGLIYQSYWGNTYTRSFPFSFHYPDTSDQKICQFDFFKIQRAWWPIYNHLKEFIPRQCRRNINVYNELSKGIYRVLMTYAVKKRQNIVDVWGLDKRNTVNTEIKKDRITFEGNSIHVFCTILEIYGTRQFIPNHYNMLLCNISQQEFYLVNDIYVKPTIAETFYLRSEWSQSDIIVAYIALSNKEYFTNFFLCTE